ncbi:MAG TPA: IclR family transcriptional regulator [Casimicrobiaceae bacterium]|jgi:DNA-binding IclR family transcriptional regulator|nr:IclR family transcriptional regulator [Casimicrobiaceae bacterium]
MGFRPAKSVAQLPQTVRRPDRPDSTTLRAFVLLELIASADEPPTLEELTRGSGLPKPTVYRILQLLIRGELVEREISAKRYVAGRRLGELSFAVQMRSPLRRERHAILARLVDEIGETCNFTMLDGNEAVYVDRVETTAVVRLHMRIGSRVPLHCTASGKLFLAHLPPASAQRLIRAAPLRRYTDRTINHPEALERELAKIRLSGIGTDVGEFLEGSVCLAVPVIDPRGRVCAAVAVHGPAPRMSLRRGYTFLPAMRRAAGAIAATLVSAAKRPVERPLRRVV